MPRLIDQPKQLKRAVAEWSIPIDYAVRFREYHLHRERPGRSLVESGYKRDIDNDWTSGVEILYCPWTGVPTPGSLRNRWFDIVNNELGLVDFDVTSALQEAKGLPKEFISEEGWVRRCISATNDRDRPHFGQIEYIDEFVIEEPDAGAPPGIRRPVGKLPHSCASMAGGFEKEDYYDFLEYLPWNREFGIRIIDPSKPVDFQPLEIEPISFCPYCGDALPASLKDERNRRLTAMGLSPGDDNIPGCLATDTWWREAGL
jgi:hypothetical protein